VPNQSCRRLGARVPGKWWRRSAAGAADHRRRDSQGNSSRTFSWAGWTAPGLTGSLSSFRAREEALIKDRPADQLREGIEQVQRWRRWLKNNRDTAVRSRAQDGLGLVSIGGDTYGLVIIGRASDREECNREYLS
jgi:hypothetical protein